MRARSLSCFRFRKRGLRGAAQKGSTAVEMALITPMFFLLLVGITEFSLMLAAQQLLDNATFNASRLAKTGFVTGGQTQAQTVSQVLNNELSSFGTLIDTNKIVLTSTAYDDFAGIGTGGTSGMGTPDQIVVYTVTYPWTFFTPLMGTMLGRWNSVTGQWVTTLTSQIVVRNEPFG